MGGGGGGNYDLHLYSANLHVIMIKFALHQVLLYYAEFINIE